MDLNWISPDVDRVQALTERPTECSAMAGDAKRDRLVRLGRVAFRSPTLLGGLAARVGMSCNSCHRNGHDNPVFFFPGVSGDPGTADVTGSVFSMAREDGIRNPVAIPSLVDASSSPPFGTIVPASDLQSFLSVLVGEEFQGAPPTESVFEGLVAYVESLRSAACPKVRGERVTFESDSRELFATLDVVGETLRDGDLGGGRFALNALRAAIERVYRRFPEAASAREGLVEISRALSVVRENLDSEGRVGRSASKALEELAKQRIRLEAVLDEVGAEIGRSFYDVGFLRRSLELDPE